MKLAVFELDLFCVLHKKVQDFFDNSVKESCFYDDFKYLKKSLKNDFRGRKRPVSPSWVSHSLKVDTRYSVYQGLTILCVSDRPRAAARGPTPAHLSLITLP